LALLLAVYYLPKLNPYQKGLILIIILIELMTSMQNSQSNGLIAGLIVFAFGLLEKNKALWATLAIVFAMFIKLFGIVGFALFLFYPQKWKSALYALIWTVILLALPLLFVDFEQYTKLFISYLNLLTSDHDASYGYSVMGWINSWFSIDVDKNLVLAGGAILFLVPLCRIDMYKEFMFKYLIACSILLWIVIFNHKAESPTFVIALTGAALWFMQSKKNTLNIILFVSAFVFASLSPTDIFPRFIRDEFVKPYVLKAVPCILIWAKVIYDLIVLKKEKNPTESGSLLIGE
jgi:hypothetical protein